MQLNQPNLNAILESLTEEELSKIRQCDSVRLLRTNEDHDELD